MMDIAGCEGAAGVFSEEGALALFPDAEHRPLPSIRKVFEAVEVGRARWGLVPMDNSQARSINETYDLFLRHGLHLVGETVVRVDHCLLALPGSTIDDLREVISHPQAIAQCEEFLNALEIDVRAEYNTAGAAKRIAEERLERTAAIASRRAAELYGLEVLAERIQTYPDNSTRFGALSRNPESLSERSEEHTSELQSRLHLVCRLLLEKKSRERLLPHTGHGAVEFYDRAPPGPRGPEL